MTTEIGPLVIAAASIAFFHTILGPDHYLPFIMMSWSRKWSTAKTIFITLLCGVGHIGSSVVLGLIGVSFGLALKKLEFLESYRGNLAAWMLIGFGLAYLVWGLRQAYRNRPHTHKHFHIDGDKHTHSHSHQQTHVHIHSSKKSSKVTLWTLFVIFVFGPCEPLIPVLMYPAAQNSWFGVILITSVFALVTISTMVGAVLLCRAGVNFFPLKRIERFGHVIGGATICLCGLAIQFFGI